MMGAGMTILVVFWAVSSIRIAHGVRAIRMFRQHQRFAREEGLTRATKYVQHALHVVRDEIATDAIFLLVLTAAIYLLHGHI